MKTIQHIVLTFGLVIGALNSAHAGESTKELVNTCKTSTLEKLTGSDDSARARFKGISGPSTSECFINAKTQEVLSIEKLS